MKRLVWLALLAFCTAIAQVPPADVPLTQHKVCGCCEDQSNACGMPDCVPQPATNQPVRVLTAQPGERAETRRLSHVPRQKGEAFYVQFVSRPALMPAFRASSVAAASASAPLFRVHCSYLI
jgi:hypothetical protein